MRQTEVQEGGIYVSKGKGMREGKRVRLEAIRPQPDGPPRLVLKDLDTGRKTYPRSDSFQQSYDPQKLPHPVLNQVAEAKRLSRREMLGDGGTLLAEVDLRGEIEALRAQVERLTKLVERRLKA